MISEFKYKQRVYTIDRSVDRSIYTASSNEQRYEKGIRKRWIESKKENRFDSYRHEFAGDILIHCCFREGERGRGGEEEYVRNNP